MVILVRAEAIDIPRSIFEEVGVVFLGISDGSEVIEALPLGGCNPLPLFEGTPPDRGENCVIYSSEHFQKFTIFSSEACIDYTEREQVSEEDKPTPFAPFLSSFGLLRYHSQ
jgi:hypothetical protein